MPISNPYGLMHCVYWPQFVARDESNDFFAQLRDSIEWKEHTYVQWNKKMPRLTAFYGDGEYKYSGLKNTGIPYNPVLTQLHNRVSEKLGMSFNGCLLNMYRTLNDSVAWHCDDEKDLNPLSPIVSLSFGDTRAFCVKPKQNKGQITRVDLNSGDLFIMLPLFQNTYLHAILKESETRRTRHEEHVRINTTFRNTKSH